jgi:hypothetical protein
MTDELEGAYKYAEKYIYYANSNPEWAKMYAEMAKQELHHADMLHKIYQDAFNDMRWVSDEDKDAWEKCVNHKAEVTALVELMLSK